MKVALVNCCFPPRHPDQLAPPQGTLSVAGALAREGHEVRVENTALAISPRAWGSDQLAAVLAGLPHELVGLSVWDNVLPFVVDATRQVRERRPEMRFLLGGPAASTVGPEILGAFPWIDGVVQGEGETGALPAFEALAAGREVVPLPRGVLVRLGHGVVAGQAPRPRLDAGAIRAPDYDTVTLSSYGRVEVVTTRGCPCACRYCSVNAVWGRGIRTRPPSSVLEEMRQLSASEVRNPSPVHVLDDWFFASAEHARTLLQEFRNAQPALRFTCYARPEDLDAPTVDALGQAGCVGLFVGVDLARGGSPTTTRMERVVRRVVRASRVLGPVIVSIIWGFPDESLAQLDHKLGLIDRFLEASDQVLVNLYQLAPLSGTGYQAGHRANGLDPSAVSGLIYSDYLPPLNRDSPVAALIGQHPQIFPAFYRVSTPDFREKQARVHAFVDRR